MPPIRNLTMPAKPVKTERSHEENQERAYIAASRRSDRSLEARVESARRASEIHKRRTGRSLRVTEQDVVNEEMYEEEDDDLPAQYRRLTAHLNTSSSDFNRRLATYLTNHVAMRQALDQAMKSQGPQGGQNGQYGQQWSPNGQNMNSAAFFQNPAMVNSAFNTNLTNVQPNMLQRQAPSMAQSPYPMNNGQGMNAPAHRPRPTSIGISNPMQPSSIPSSTLNSPVANFHQNNQQAARESGSATSNSPRSPNTAQDLPSGQRSNSDNQVSSIHAGQHDASSNAQQQNSTGQPGVYNMQQTPWSGSPAQMTPTSPFTTQLPVETQMFMNPGMNTPWESTSGPPFSYSYNPNFNSKKSSNPQMSGGMSQTLAPPAFETKGVTTSFPTPPSSDEHVSPYTASGNLNFGGADSMFNDDFGAFDGMFADGQATPIDEFTSYIDQSAWDEPAEAPA